MRTYLNNIEQLIKRIDVKPEFDYQYLYIKRWFTFIVIFFNIYIYKVNNTEYISTSSYIITVA